MVTCCRRLACTPPFRLVKPSDRVGGVTGVIFPMKSTPADSHLHLLAAEAMWQADGRVVPVAPQRQRGGPHSGPGAVRGEEGLGGPRGGLARRRVRATAAAGHSGALGLVEAPTPRPRARGVAVLEGFSLLLRRLANVILRRLRERRLGRSATDCRLESWSTKRERIWRLRRHCSLLRIHARTPQPLAPITRHTKLAGRFSLQRITIHPR